MIRILVSACLLGDPVRYDGRPLPMPHELMPQWHREGRLVPCCPEMDAGLPVPRPAAEIVGGDGEAVWRDQARVMNRRGADMTAVFIRGAQMARDLALAHGVRLAILKEKSPSCGSTVIYGGDFSGTLLPGAGVTTTLLKKAGLAVFSQEQIAEAAAWLARAEPKRS